MRVIVRVSMFFYQYEVADIDGDLECEGEDEDGFFDVYGVDGEYDAADDGHVPECDGDL